MAFFVQKLSCGRSSIHRRLSGLGFAALVTFIGSSGMISGQMPAVGSTPAKDWSLGQPRIWYYERVYPFLDGIFQDVASTQLVPLVLSPNAADASKLNAIQSSFGLGLSYSSPTAAGNALAQQSNAVITANAQLQTELLAQQAQLTQQVLTATQQVGQATVAYDQLNGSANPDPNQLANAKSALTVAQDQLNSFTAQLNAVKAQLPTTISATPTAYNSASASQPTSVTLPTNLSQLTAPPNAPPTPNFPSSKQMDNQFNLLWERLSRLVSTIAQADSLKDRDILLAAFDVNLLPSRENNRVFGAQYGVSGCSGTPVIVDLFPSASAVNIVSTQYKDSRGAIGAVVSWFGFGLNAAYNREHLQISQQLGQSAYITGFGIGTSSFGWFFGRNLGDKEVSPGKRTVFAVIAVPHGCSNLSIKSQRAGWVKDNFEAWYASIAKKDKYVDSSSSLTLSDLGSMADPVVTEVDYSPREFDSTSSAATIASVRITLRDAMDPQMTLSVDGNVLPRARDTFARAIPNSGGAGGLLESGSYSVNTWVPTSDTSLILSLDASKVEKRFPDIVLSSTRGSISLTSVLPKLDANGGVPKTTVFKVRGDSYGCFSPCISNMTPLSYRKAPTQTLSVFHLDGGSSEDAQVIFSLASDAPPTPNAGSGTSNVQVLTSGPSPWGGNATVLAEFDQSTSTRLLRLSCSAIDGMRLSCRMPAVLKSALESDISFEVHDPDHAGGPVSATISIIKKPGGSEFFRVWSQQAPRWKQGLDSSGKSTTLLSFCATFANTSGTDSFALGYANGATIGGPDFQFHHDSPNCPKPSQGGASFWSGELAIPIVSFPIITDQMSLVRVGQPDPPATLLFLRSAVQPTVFSASDDYKHLYGQGLVFPQMRVGDSQSIIPLTCDPAGTSCHADPSANLGTGSGPVYLQTSDGIAVTLMKNTNGVVAAFGFVPPSKPTNTNPGPNGPSGPGSVGQLTFGLNLSATGNGGSQQPNSPPNNANPLGSGPSANVAPATPPPPGAPAPLTPNTTIIKQ
jgi:hypothetical protein